MVFECIRHKNKNKLKRTVESHMYKDDCTAKGGILAIKNVYNIIRCTTFLHNLEISLKSYCRETNRGWL